MQPLNCRQYISAERWGIFGFADYSFQLIAIRESLIAYALNAAAYRDSFEFWTAVKDGIGQGGYIAADGNSGQICTEKSSFAESRYAAWKVN